MAEQYQDTIEEVSEPQAFILESRASKILEMAGQGGGKTRTIGIQTGMMVSEFPQVRGFIGANTALQLAQSTLVGVYKAWREIWGYTMYHPKSNPLGAFVVDQIPPAHFKRLHDMGKHYHGTISFYNGAMIFIGSLENYMAHDGKEFGWAHLDETKDTKEDAITEVIDGRLRQYGLWFDQAGDLFFDDTIDAAQAEGRGWTDWNPLFIHTSPAKGGVKWLNDMFDLQTYEKEIKRRVMRKEKDYYRHTLDDKAVAIYSSHHNQPNLPPNYIKKREKGEWEKVLRLVYGFPFGKSGGEYFPAFRRDLHVGIVPRIERTTIAQAWDFNVVPFMTLLCANFQYIIRYLDENGDKHHEPGPGFKAIDVLQIRVYKGYFFKSPRNSSDAVCKQFEADHPPGAVDVDLYGDASGRARIPGLGVSNFDMIEEKLYKYMHNDSMKVAKANMSVLTRRDFMNKIFSGEIPYIEIIIDEEVDELIEDCEYVKLGPAGKVKEKVKDEDTGAMYEKRGHPTDALEYLVCEACKDYIGS